MISKSAIEKDVLYILQTEFNVDISMINLQNENVFGEKIGILPRNYLNLINLIEKKYSILIQGDDIEKYKLKNISQLVDLIFDKLKES
jgi:acyl carrier protein